MSVAGRFGVEASAEWRSQRRRPFVWLSLAAYFLLAAGDTAQAGWSATGGAWINGADAISTRAIIYSLLSVLVAAGVVGEPFARDRAHGVSGSVLTTGVERRALALGRFAVATAIVLASGFLFVPGVVVGAMAPGIPREFIGPFAPEHYGLALAAFVMPNFFLMCALVFAVSARTQSVAAGYGAGVAFVAVWVTSRMLLGQDVLRHDVFTTYALLDPFGGIASAEFAMGQTVAQNNTAFPPVRGLLVVNRLIWAGVAVGLVALGVAGFPTRERLARSPRRRVRAAPWLGRVTSWAPKGGATGRVFAWELRAVVRGPGTAVVLAMLVLTLWWSAASAVTHRFSLPSTDLLVHNTGFYFDKILVLLVVWVAGDLIWRERTHRVDSMIDVLPTPDRAVYLGKLLALLTLVIAVWGVSIVVNVVYQALHGYYDFELWLHLTDSYAFKAPYYLFLGVLSLTVQILVRKRFVAMGLVLAVYLAEVLLDAVGVYHPVFRYGRSSFFWYSLMDGYGHFVEAHVWMLGYWALGASAIGLLGWAAMTRGSDPPSRRALLRWRLGARPGAAWGCVMVVGFAGVGAWVWRQSTMLAPWPPIDADRLMAEVERAYGPAWRGVRQPRVVAIQAELDLYPGERRFECRGRFVLHNPHDTQVDRVLILAEPWLRVEEVVIPDATQQMQDPALNARAFRLDNPMPPGGELEMAFKTSWSPPRGFAVHAENDGIPQVAPVEVIGNGTSLLNLQIMPAVGYTDRVEHKPGWRRRKYGLNPEWEAPAGTDATSQAHATLHLDWVRHIDMTIRTAPDQTAYHPGRLVSTWTEADGRRAFRYVIDRPSRGWATIVSGRLVETRSQRSGLPDVVMAHDPDHTHTVQAFAAALHDAMAHFARAYGPPPFEEFRMVEQSLHFDGMGTRSGMGFASEVLGWKSDLKASGGEDLHAMAAHLMGMTWWGDQVIPANTAGAKVVHAGLPYWSAQLYLHQRRDPATDRRARRQALLEAFRSRSALVDVESPYVREFKDSGMLRAKGAGQMLHLARLMGGPTELEAVLSRFLDRWRYAGAPYPQATDLVDHLRDALPAEHHDLLADVFEHVTTWDLSVRQATAAPRAGGGWTLSAAFDARQLRTTGWGQSETAPFTAPIDVVAFGRGGTRGRIILRSETRTPDNGSFTISWDLDELPEEVGIDPDLLLPDPNPHDNTRRVTPRR